MKSSLLASYPASAFVTFDDKAIYVADFSERTGKVRGVEIHPSIPSDPNDTTKDMDCLRIHNNKRMSVVFNVFDDHQFKTADNHDMEHCECCFFPSVNSDTTFVGFVEIKDCKSKNISDYKAKTKEQIINTVRQFREKGIIDKQEIFGVISFPRKRTAYDLNIFSDYTEYKRLYKTEKIHFIATNDVYIINDKTLNFKEINKQ